MLSICTLILFFFPSLVQVLFCLFLSLTKSTNIHTTWCSLALLECILWRKGLNGILLLTRRCHLLVADTRHGRDHRKPALTPAEVGAGSSCQLCPVLPAAGCRVLSGRHVRVSACLRCICVVCAEIHWMYPRSPRAGVSLRGQLSLDGCCWCFHPRCSVCCYQFNLSVCFLHTCAHTHARCNGWKCKCQVFSLNKASETII